MLVDFWAEWCGPRHAVAPVLEQIAEEREGELKVVKLNIDDEQELAMRYGVMSIPTMILFRDGEPAATRSMGAAAGHRARARPGAGRGGLTGQLSSGGGATGGLLAVRLRAEQSHFEPARLLK